MSVINRNILTSKSNSAKSNRGHQIGLSEGMLYHITHAVQLDNPVYRPGSEKFFSLFREAKALYQAGLYEANEDEREILESDIGEWGMYMGKKVPLDFPMWSERLDEAFADHYPTMKGKWVEVTKAQMLSHPEVFEEIFNLIDLSYSYIGGHANYKTPNDLIKDADISVFSLINIDDEPQVDAVNLAKTTAFGRKSLASATDGSSSAKNVLKTRLISKNQEKGNYAEVSDAMAKLMLRNNVPVISDEMIVRKILSGKSITWYGQHPGGAAADPTNANGWYSRKIGGEDHVKIMVGIPNISTLGEAKYKGREVTLGAKGAKRSGGRAHVYVRDPKSGKVKKVSFGSGAPDAMGDSDAHRKRRKSFGNRHGCSKNKNKMSASYWACRATKMFGRNIAGWW